MITVNVRDGLAAIINDLRHSARVDDYELPQIAFIESIATRLTVVAADAMTQQPAAKAATPATSYAADASGDGTIVGPDGHRLSVDEILAGLNAAPEPGVGEAVAWLIDWPDEPELGHYFSEDRTENGRSRPLYLHPAPADTAPPTPQGDALAGKYGDVLRPFVAMMDHELHANAGKGDRPGWLTMDRKTALLEIYYHLAKLQKAAKDNHEGGIREYAADVANMSMMLVDVCGCLPAGAIAAQAGEKSS